MSSDSLLHEDDEQEDASSDSSSSEVDSQVRQHPDSSDDSSDVKSLSQKNKIIKSNLCSLLKSNWSVQIQDDLELLLYITISIHNLCCEMKSP